MLDFPPNLWQTFMKSSFRLSAKCRAGREQLVHHIHGCCPGLLYPTYASMTGCAVQKLMCQLTESMKKTRIVRLEKGFCLSKVHVVKGKTFKNKVPVIVEKNSYL